MTQNFRAENNVTHHLLSISSFLAVETFLQMKSAINKGQRPERPGCSAPSQRAHSPEFNLKTPNLEQPGYFTDNKFMAPNGEIFSRTINNTCSL